MMKARNKKPAIQIRYDGTLDDARQQIEAARSEHGVQCTIICVPTNKRSKDDNPLQTGAKRHSLEHF